MPISAKSPGERSETRGSRQIEDVDGRDKPGHDEAGSAKSPGERSETRGSRQIEDVDGRDKRGHDLKSAAIRSDWKFGPNHWKIGV